MIFRYVIKDLVRNPRRTLSTVIGVFLGIALTCAILFFVDGLSASMTQRAIAPLPIDMQRVVTTIGGASEIALSYTPSGRVVTGDIVSVRLSFKNIGETPANEVVIRSVLDSKLRYIPDSARVAGEAVGGGEENPFSRGLVKEGFNIGTVQPGTVVAIEYQAEIISDVDLSDQYFNATFSTREVLTPIKANVNKPISLEGMARQIRDLDGVQFAEQLFISDLPSGSLASHKNISGPIRVFGFDPAYTEEDVTIKIVTGTQESGAVILSVEAAEKLAVGVNDMVTLTLPDATRISKRISGIADLTRARSLFSSRHGANLEVFLYVPNSIIFDVQTFTNEILPTFERAVASRGGRVKSLPIQEIDIKVERELLNAEPATALQETKLIATSIEGTAKGQGFVLDHVSNTLEVARGDARVAKQMFVFLGLPGVLLAAFLAAYAGIVLSSSQRREQATLRIRGASRSHLLSMLTVRVSCITVGGALLGVALGFVTAVLIIGLATLFRATGSSLLVSAVIGTVSGLLATGSALYITGRRSIDQEISEDRAKFINHSPQWRRYWFDLIGIAVVVGITFFVIMYDGFAGSPGSVYVGQSVEIPLTLLFLPIATWIFGSLFGGRICAYILEKLKPISLPEHSQPLSFLYGLSIRRRAWALAEASIIIGLIIALGTSLAVFTDSYKGAKTADARYITGSDIKISTSPASKQTYHSIDSEKFIIENIEAVSPVMYGIHNVVLRSHRTTDVANLAAVDPDTYLAVAPFKDTYFSKGSAQDSIALLNSTPRAVLLSADMAKFMQVKVGESMHILLGKATSAQTEIEVMVVGLFDKLPGFPDGADALMHIALHEATAPALPVTFFLAKTKEQSDEGLEHIARMLQDGVGADNALVIESRLTSLAKDQSSLAALNIDGLLKIDSIYSLAMGTVVIAIFVFGLLLSRRREYVTLKAQGMSSGVIRALIGAEALTATIAGVIIGIPVGLVMAYYFINVLRPLFILNPPYQIPFESLSIIVGSVIVTALITSAIASIAVNRLKATELLRDE